MEIQSGSDSPGDSMQTMSDLLMSSKSAEAKSPPATMLQQAGLPTSSSVLFPRVIYNVFACNNSVLPLCVREMDDNSWHFRVMRQKKELRAKILMCSSTRVTVRVCECV